MNNREVANNYLEETKSLKENLEKNCLELGKRLLKIRDEQLFLATHSSFVEFLWEVKMTESTASKMISIYSHFILELGVDEKYVLNAGGWTTAYEAKALATTKEKAIEALETAATLSPKDWKIYLGENKTGIIQSECDHPDMVRFDWCKKCNAKLKVYPDEN